MILLSLLAVSATASGADGVPGFFEKRYGEAIVYFSPLHRFADRALLTRANGAMPVRWMAPAVESAEKTVTYRLLTGHSSGTSGGRRMFDFRLNGTPLFTIITQPGQTGSFTLQGGDSDTAGYFFKSVEYDQNGDAFGYLYLTVPAHMVRDSACMEIIGQDQQSRDWFMVFMHREQLQIEVEPTALVTRNENKRQLNVYAENPYPRPLDVTVSSAYFKSRLTFLPGYNAIVLPAWAADFNGADTVFFSCSDPDTVLAKVLRLPPVRDFEFHIIHHSHNDIGYSHLQQEVERIQCENIRNALRWVDKCTSAEQRPVWHIESLWAVENFLREATADEKERFLQAVKDRRIVLSANYANVLTGLCRSEEQAWNTEYARRLEKQFGLKIANAMITDIPGITQAGLKAYVENDIRYLSLGPNYVENLPDHGDRVGGVIREQGDVAFYWKPTPDYTGKLLVWTAGKGYSYFHNITSDEMQRGWEDRLSRYCNQLYEKEYPYAIVQLRYTKKADNGPVDTALCTFVDDWNRRFRSPRLVISDLDSLFARFERMYGDQLPILNGEISPYWEDGAFSSAVEEIRNRDLAAATIALESFALKIGKRSQYEEEFYRLHRYIVLFNEHTWGSWCSISDPDLPFTTLQWEYKKSFLDSGIALYGRLSAALEFREKKFEPLPAVHPVTDFDIDLRYGGIQSATVKGENMVDTAGPYRLFQMVYVSGVDPSSIHQPEDLKVLGWRNDKRQKVVTVAYSLKNSGRITATYRLDKSIGSLDCTIEFDKSAIREKESMHMALPFNMDHPELRYGSEGGRVVYGKDQLAGSNRDFICAEDHVELDDGKKRLVIRSPQFNLFEVGDIIDESRIGGAKVWKKQNGNTSRLFLYLLNNYWHTNYKASQQGRVSFDVSISAK